MAFFDAFAFIQATALLFIVLALGAVAANDVLATAGDRGPAAVPAQLSRRVRRLESA
jgi:hypothetical protein